LQKKLLALNSGQYQSDSVAGEIANKPTSKDTLAKESNTKTSSKLLRVLKDTKDWKKNMTPNHDKEVEHLQDVVHVQTDKVSHIIDDITTILSGVQSGHLPKVLSGMLVNLTESETKRRMPLNFDSSLILSNTVDQRGLNKSSKSSTDTAAGKRRQSKHGSKSRFAQNQSEFSSQQALAKASGKESSDSTRSFPSTTEPKGPYPSPTDTQKQQYGQVISSYSELDPSLSANDQNVVEIFSSADQKETTQAARASISFASGPTSTTDSSYSRLPFQDENSDFEKSPKDLDMKGDTERFQLGEAATQTPGHNKHIGFASDDALNRRPKFRIGLTKAFTQPVMQVMNVTDANSSTDYGSGRWRG